MYQRLGQQTTNVQSIEPFAADECFFWKMFEQFLLNRYGLLRITTVKSLLIIELAGIGKISKAVLLLNNNNGVPVIFFSGEEIIDFPVVEIFSGDSMSQKRFTAA